MKGSINELSGLGEDEKNLTNGFVFKFLLLQTVRMLCSFLLVTVKIVS